MDTSFHISINSLGFLSLSRTLAEYSLQLVYIPPCAGKISKFMVFIFLKNTWNLRIFTYVSPHSKLALKSLSHPRQKEITHSPRQHFFGNPFSPTVERGGENYDLLYQNRIRKYKDELGHCVICILYDL